MELKKVSLAPDDWFEVIARSMGERIDTSIKASSVDAALKGLAILTEKTAEVTQLEPGTVVCLMASLLLREDGGDEQNTVGS